ncbi:MAG: VWA domain-containing protein [Deltaproteobacteria bacterium]|nr:VWA domain-containing protein [Deltaproteobacteria bacterium]
MIEVAWPWAFALAPLPWIVRRLAPAAPERRAGALRIPFFDSVASLRGAHTTAARGRTGVLAAMTVAWLALVVAAARPTWVGEPVALPAEGRDLMLAVDISGSMAREDFTVGGQAADRLTVVKAVANDFIGRREGDRVGLVLFGTRAYLQSPLTFDRPTVRTFLDDAEIGLAGEETAIGDAIGIATKRLRDRPAESRVLVLLTDGASNAGALDPMEAAKLAAAEGIRIYTIGVGADQIAVPGLFGSRIVNPSADLDERTLAGIADLTGGEYFRAKNVEGLANVYREIDELEPSIAEPLYVRPTKELFQWPLGMALALSLGLGFAEARPWSALASARSGAEITEVVG